MILILILCRWWPSMNLWYHEYPREFTHGGSLCQKQVHLAWVTQSQQNPWDFEKCQGGKQICQADYNDPEEKICTRVWLQWDLQYWGS